MSVWVLLIPAALSFLLLVVGAEKEKKDLVVISLVMLVVSLVLGISFTFLPFFN